MKNLKCRIIFKDITSAFKCSAFTLEQKEPLLQYVGQKEANGRNFTQTRLLSGEFQLAAIFKNLCFISS